MRPEDMLTEGTTTGQEETEAYDETKENTSSKEQETSSAQMTEMVSENSSESAETAETEPKSSEPPKPEESAAGMETAPAESEPLEPYQMQYEELYKVYREIASSMVTVTAVHADVDWFNNTDQSEGTTAGVIIANNNRELLILSRKSSLDNAQAIRVSFCDGVEADAVIKQYDENTDLAVLAVDLKYIASDTLSAVTVATLGSSIISGITGTPVIAVGNLFGYKDTVCYGMITSKNNVVTMADSEYKLMTTDIYAGTNPSGILVDMNREVIGIIDNSHNHEDTKNLLSAVGITELKGLITKLSNGEDIPYLGIYVQDISEQSGRELNICREYISWILTWILLQC